MAVFPNSLAVEVLKLQLASSLHEVRWQQLPGEIVLKHLRILDPNLEDCTATSTELIYWERFRLLTSVFEHTSKSVLIQPVGA